MTTTTITKNDIKESTKIMEKFIKENAKLFATTLVLTTIEILEGVGKENVPKRKIKL